MNKNGPKTDHRGTLVKMFVKADLTLFISTHCFLFSIKFSEQPWIPSNLSKIVRFNVLNIWAYMVIGILPFSFLLVIVSMMLRAANSVECL